MKSIRRFVVIVVAVYASGCASIVSKSKYPVSINTDPPAARIEVRDQHGVVKFAGVSPATAILHAGDGYFSRAYYTVTASKDGYTPASMPIQNSIDGWYWANFLIGGVIGLLIVDPATGAMFEIDTPHVGLNLAAVNSVAADTGRLQQLKELRTSGVLTEAEYQSKRKAALRDL